MKNQPIEDMMWRCLKILSVCDYTAWLQAINITHPCTNTRLTRYINNLLAAGYLHQTGDYRFTRTARAPAAAPIFRKGVKNA